MPHYIATDERDKGFFNIFKDNYDVLFLDDFMDVIKDVDTNYYGMIDQLVARGIQVTCILWHVVEYTIRLRESDAGVLYYQT